MKIALKYFIFALAPLLALVIAAEVLTRIFAGDSLNIRAFRTVEEGVIEYRSPLGEKTRRFQDPKPPGVFRIFCLGGSSTFGGVFSDRSGFPERLEVMLSAGSGPLRFEVINVAYSGLSTDENLRILKQALRFEPDLVISYMGHNEMTDLSKWNRIAHPNINRIWSFLIEKSAAFNAMIQLYHSVFLTGRLEHLDLVVKEERTHLQVYTPEIRREAVENFKANMKDIIELCKDHQTGLLMMTLISNESDIFPFKSAFGTLLDDKEQKEYGMKIQVAYDLLKEEKYEQAKNLLDQLIGLDGDYALAHFLRGRSLLAMEKYEQAKEDFIKARDLDDFPARAPTVINRAIREIGEEDGIALLDLEELLRDLSPHRIIGFNLCYDYVHQTLLCQQLIAEAVLGCLVQNMMVPPDLDTEKSALDLEQINRRLGISDRYLAQKYFYIAFVLGFTFSKDIYLDRAEELLELSQTLDPEDFMSQLVLGVLKLRSGDPEGARKIWEDLLVKDARQFNSIAGYYFYPGLQVIDELVLFDPAYDFMTPLRVIRQSWMESVNMAPVQNEQGILEDPYFLAKFNHAWEWNEQSGRLIDVSRELGQLMEKRRRILNASPHGSLQPIDLKEFQPVNCRKESRTDSLVSINQDPQLVFQNVLINPLLAGSINIKLECRTPEGKEKKDVRGDIYWSTRSNPEFSEKRKLTFIINADGLEHQYKIQVANRWQWINSDTITRIRVDPGDQPGYVFTFHEFKINPLIKP